MPKPGHRRIFSRVFSVCLVNVAAVCRVGFTVYGVWRSSVYSEKSQVPADDFLTSRRWVECRACGAGAFGDVHDGVCPSGVLVVVPQRRTRTTA